MEPLTELPEDARKLALDRFPDQVWSDYRPVLLGFIRHRIRDADLAEDILQDVLTKAHSHLRTLADSDCVRGWLYKIARNTIADYYRTRRNAEPLPEDLVELADPHDKWPEEIGRCVLPMIELLPERYRTPLILFEIDGLPLKLVAQRLHLSLPGAKSRVQRGREKLKTIFLQCCRFTFDGRGKPIACSPRDGCKRVGC